MTGGFYVACLWAVTCLTYMVILMAMHLTIPEEALIIWLGEIFGGEGRALADDFFMTGGAVINFLLIWLVAAFCLRSYLKTDESNGLQ